MVPITPRNISLLLPSSPDAAFYRERGLRDLKRALKAPRFEGKAKNVIVFVGDGLGVSTHTMSRIYKGQKKGRSGEEESLVWEDWDYSGLIKVSLLRPNHFTQKCCGSLGITSIEKGILPKSLQVVSTKCHQL